MSSEDTTVIRTQGLSKAYNGVTALQDLDLTVRQHSICGFLGPNGAGKTTTIKLLLGLTRPTRGTATVFGHDITTASAEIRRRVGYLSQEPRYYDHFTARETLRFTAGFFYSGPKAQIEARVAETLELVGLDDKADRPIRGFSGGEVQRLGIAQAQVNYPDLLILDEPAASLDPMGRRDVLAVMERLRQYTTIFYSTHILSDVQRVSDTVVILNHGALVTEAPIQDLLTGSEGSVYSLTIRGDAGDAHARVLDQPWVTGITAGEQGDQTSWEVQVTDDEAAEDQLLRLVLADRGLQVTSSGRKQYELEEVFMDLVEEESDG
ncbi:MAG: multidrug ABC transporter ATP-binding protein [Dehalococcoidia bacterium]|nr:multidrug ABC transporter ATP-binding protein [Dehalococcoidia bacterium]